MVKMIFPVRFSMNLGSMRPMCKGGQVQDRCTSASEIAKAHCELREVTASSIDECYDKAIELGYFIEDTAKFLTL